MATKLMDAAKKNKADEFYTQLNDIELELKHYKECFKDKTVLCNCDDPFESNFFKYFAMNFNYLGLKRLICTCYDGSPFVGEQLSLFDFMDNKQIEEKKTAYKIEITEVRDINNDGATDLYDVETLIKNKKNILTKLQGNGDFRSNECIKLLKESDIVVTNPPFSLFREYVAQLQEYNKKFIIIGNTNALTYKEIFRLFQENKIRTGYTNFNVGMYFLVPEETQNYHKIIDGKKYVRVSTSCWFTNMPVKKHNEMLTFYKKYDEEKYPKYLNYDAINVDKYSEIPDDYYECVGVPVTFLDKYNPDQFEIIRFRKGNDGKDLVYMRERESTTLLQNNCSKKEALINFMLAQDFNVNQIEYCNGEIGVPITFLDKYNPNQFEIIALGIVGSINFAEERKMEVLDKDGLPTGKYTINAKGTLYRKWSKEIDGEKPAAFKDCETGELYQSIYARVIIKRRV